jgi:glucosamine-6-phosphate deaminase
MHVNGMTIRSFRSPAGAARALARAIGDALASQPSLVLGLPTGRTPLLLYRELAERHRRGALDFSRASTFNLDEFVGIAPEDPRSYRTFMERALFGHVNISPRRVHFLDGSAPDLALECRRYERAIRRAGGIDLLLLGLGVNGHVGFNEPSGALTADTHVARLAATTRRANAEAFVGLRGGVPRCALSMGMGTILRARRIVLLATGAAKAQAVRMLVRGPITTRVHASFLQTHPSAEVWVDEAAGAGLSDLARKKGVP